MDRQWTLTIPSEMREELQRHLFPGDEDEHAAVIVAGIARSARGTRLLARELFLAADGVDFVPGKRAYKMLTASFIRERIRYCREERLVYLGVHNHLGSDAVEFSEPDLRSHERGYPALLGISGQPVGGLVFAENAIAGDIWTPDRVRRALAHTVVLGRDIARVHPSPPPEPPDPDPQYDRQVRWLGKRGQDFLANTKVAVIGGGGVGLPLTTMLARLGVGTIVVIDPDRLVPENLPRMPEARRSDALMALRALPGGEHPAVKRFLDGLGTRKTRLARRAVRRANPKARFVGIAADVASARAVEELLDCDFIFQAADTHMARNLANVIAHQYLIPMIQMGTRIDVAEQTGLVGDIRSTVRLVLPHRGCLRCSDCIDATKLQEDATGAVERERNRYVNEIPAPSVITFNTEVAAKAASDFLLMLGGLLDQRATLANLRFRPRLRECQPIEPAPGQPGCPHCGTGPFGRLARGETTDLPVPER